MSSVVVRNALQIDNLLRMGFLWTLIIMVSYMMVLYHLLRGSSIVFPRRSMASVGRWRACIVTGASSGIGKVVAKALALEGYHVILAGHMSGELHEAVAEIKSECIGVSLHSVELDLCSVASILAFVDAVESWILTTYPHHDLQLLVNNAGILAASQRFTPEGYDSMMATNYLGPFLLTKLLLPLLEKSSEPARIVNVVSFTHRCVRSLKINEELFLKGTVQKSLNRDWYRMARIYEASKMCLLLFSYELERRLGNLGSRVTVMVADPGIVKTSILQELPQLLVNITHLGLKILGLLQSPDAGARAIIDAALAPMVDFSFLMKSLADTSLEVME
ncbi:hypothetical protein O6H91_21G024700 [Diphasiastrum complanatum]|uniref:Uncharacterized protein n=1 Tax=Diphasiastrum complanatum TaxID=34168 RepID=A0ACC2AJ25_DIPCM|nr:hypothetical protein O6H91_21G024700 [Diphasiastrum complanatum]